MSDRPYPGESLSAFRERRRTEMANPGAPASGFEAAKAKVAAQHGKWSEGSSKKAVNLDTAATDADELGSTHKRLAGGVKPVVADKEADKGKSDWNKLSEADQIAAARGSKSAHTTETPGATHQTSMAAAMQAAQSKNVTPVAPGTAERIKSGQTAGGLIHSAVKERGVTFNDKGQRSLGPKPDAATTARNNMAVTHSTVDTSAVAGLTGGSSQAERDHARKAATKGTRGGNRSAEAAAAARSSSRRSAASASPVTGPQFSGAGSKYDSPLARGFAAIVAPNPGPSSNVSDKPAASVSNPAAHAPTPASNATPAAPSAPTTQPGPLAHENIIGSKPSKGVSPHHMVSSAPGRDWLTPQAANKAKKASAPKEAVAEEPALVSSAPAEAASKNKPATDAHKVAQNVGRAVGNVNRTPMDSGNNYSGARDSIGAQRTPMAAQQMAKVSSPAPAASGSGTVGRGRTNAAPRSPEVGGGRVSGGAAGGLHIANEGDNNSFNNIGNVTHNTTVNNYGTMNGNAIGNAGSGGGRPGGYGGSNGRRPAGGSDHDEHEGGFNAWYKDSSGMHDLRKGIDHVTGRTGGHGERLDTGKTPSVTGGTQRPIKGSPRAASVTPAPGATAGQPTFAQGTGTTNNWQGPQHVHTASASGNGTATPAPAASPSTATTSPWPRMPGPTFDN